MATITELIIAASVEPSGVKRGLDQAVGYARTFGRDVETAIAAGGMSAGSSTTFESRGAKMVEAILGGAQSRLASTQGALREQMARGIITPEEFRKQGALAAQGFNQSLLAGITQLQGRNQLSSGMRDMLVNALEPVDAGEKAGRSFAQSLTATIHRHRALIPTLAGLVLSQSLGGAGDVAKADPMEKTVETGKAAEKILENVAMLASFLLDPIPGLIAAVVGGAAAAVVKIWTHAKEETAKARKEFTTDLNKMIDEFDTAGTEKKLQDVMFGKRSAGAADNLADGYRGGLNDLRTMQSRAAERQRQMEMLLPAPIARTSKQNADLQAIKDEIATRAPLIQEAETQRVRLETALTFRPGNAKPGNKGLAPFVVTAEAIGTPLEEAIKKGERLTEQFRKIHELGLTPSLRMLHEMSAAEGDIRARLADETDQRSKHAGQLRAALVDLQKINRAVRDIPSKIPGFSIIGSPAEGDEQERASALATRLASAEAMGDMRTRAAVMHDLAVLQTTITMRIRDEGGLLRANLGLLQAQKQVMDAMASHITGPAMPSAFASIASTVTTAQDARRQADAARALNAGNADALETRANVARERAIALLRSMIEATNSDTASTKEGRAALEQLLDIVNTLGDTTGKTATNFDAMRNAIQGALDAAGGFGTVGRDVRDVAQSILHTVDAFRALDRARKAAQASASTSATIAEVGAGIGAVGGIIGAVGALATIMQGDSAAREQQAQTLRDNNERLRELRVSLDGSLTTGKASARLSTAATTLSDDFWKHPGMTLVEGIVKQGEDIKAMGQTWDELRQKAKDLGITLFDAKGGLLEPALKQLADALRIEAEKITKFTQSWDDQLSLSQLQQRVSGKGKGGADTYNATLALLERFAPELAKGLQGIDVATEDGRRKIEEALQALVASLMAGSITLEQYGDLEGAKQLAAIIAMLQDSLDSLSNAADSVTSSLLNVPQGFKVNLARFNATTAQGGPMAPGGGSDAGGGWVPNTPGFVPSSASANMVAVRGTSGEGGIVVNGDIYVDAHAQSPDEMFKGILKVAKRRAQLTFGDSTQWSRVQEA